MDRGELAELLRAHQPADEVERGHRDAIVALLGGAEDPFSRASYTPGHVTASAFVLSPDRRSVLLIWHGKLHRWLQPGGHLDAGDGDVVAAARREVAEETAVREVAPGPGFPALLDVDVHVIPPNPKRGEPEHRHFDVRVALVAASDTIQAGDDALDARWVALDEVAAMETDASVLRAVARLRAAVGA
jgi:8-oxo-dGTP pyrophosphatase MutT (NUDIX family)